jgi:hypothetical protein
LSWEWRGTDGVDVGAEEVEALVEKAMEEEVGVEGEVEATFEVGVVVGEETVVEEEALVEEEGVVEEETPLENAGEVIEEPAAVDAIVEVDDTLVEEEIIEEEIVQVGEEQEGVETIVEEEVIEDETVADEVWVHEGDDDAVTYEGEEHDDGGAEDQDESFDLEHALAEFDDDELTDVLEVFDTGFVEGVNEDEGEDVEGFGGELEMDGGDVEEEAIDEEYVVPTTEDLAAEEEDGLPSESAPVVTPAPFVDDTINYDSPVGLGTATTLAFEAAIAATPLLDDGTTVSTDGGDPGDVVGQSHSISPTISSLTHLHPQNLSKSRTRTMS